MKVLFVGEENSINHYADTLRKALIANGLEVAMNVDDLWNEHPQYDIFHFNWWAWPSYNLELNDENFQKICNQIHHVKKYAKFVMTCHEIERPNPFYYYDLAHNFYLKNCDAMIHLGQYTYDKLKQQNQENNIKQYIIPHHIYDNYYRFDISKNEARKRLKISQQANVMLCFGDFRNNDERSLVYDAWQKVDYPHKYLLAPRFYRLRRNIILGFDTFVKAMQYKINGVHSTGRAVPDNMLETYFCAADVIMLQRRFIINSGNLPLGYQASKIVVGPDVGNVGPILHETHNPFFNPDDINSVKAAIEEGFRLSKTELPHKNHDYAYANWNVDKIAKQHIEVYRDILKTNNV
ncbi:MAG: hypothetical protein LBR13_06215 [Dysgonamonadaceae bacterium]|jgi:hypothetical protein|nr:hypothetical protein [Dysgonamonadaceae bacterium]